MKTKSLLILVIFVSMFFAACSDDDNSEFTNVPESVQKAFESRYQNVKDVKWEKVQDYHVARFNNPITKAIYTHYTSSAWFTENGKFCQSDEDIDFENLPVEVQNGFKAYQVMIYPDCKIDECEMLNREGMGLVYVIEVEIQVKAGEYQEREISMSEDGAILKDVLDDDDEDEILPIEMPEEILTFLKNFYPENYNDIVILELETDDDEIEMDIMEGDLHKEITLDAEYNWLSTEYDATVEGLLEMLDASVAEKLIKMAGYDDLDLNDPDVRANAEVEISEDNENRMVIEIEYKDSEQEYVIVDGQLQEDEE